MKGVFYRLLVAAVLAMMISSCGRTTTQTQNADLSETGRSAIPWAVSEYCLITKARQPKITVCVQGSGNTKEAEDKTRKALTLWLDAIRPLDAKVTKKILFSCEAPDTTVFVYQGSGQEHSNGQNINVFDSSPLGTYLHEYGHAFACLGDTYAYGTAGYCVYGQPHSVMCDGLLVNELSQDDIAGVRGQFKSLAKN